MRIMQIVYPGLGGNSSVAFSFVEGQNNRVKIKNFFLFCGVENLISSYKNQCKKLNIDHTYLRKKKYRVNTSKIINIVKKKKPNVIVIHDYNMFPFFLYSLSNNVKLIYVHHTPDRTKKIIDWLAYLFNSILSNKVVLVSKRKKSDLISIINKIFFPKKINIIENGINVKKFKK